MKKFLNEFVWVSLASYLLIVLLAGTALGRSLHHPSLDTVKVSSEKLNLLTFRDYPIYSVLLNKSRQAIVRIWPLESSYGELSQLAKNESELSLSEIPMLESFVALPTPIQVPQRKGHHHPVPFHILKFHF